MNKKKVKDFIEFCADKVVQEKFPFHTYLYNPETDSHVYTKEAQKYFDLTIIEIKNEFNKLIINKDGKPKDSTSGKKGID